MAAVDALSAVFFKKNYFVLIHFLFIIIVIIIILLPLRIRSYLVVYVDFYFCVVLFTYLSFYNDNYLTVSCAHFVFVYSFVSD